MIDSSDSSGLPRLHETVLDTQSQQVAAIYAKALLGAADKAGQTLPVLEQLASLITDVLDTNPRFDAVISSPMVDGDEKVGILERTLKSQASPLLLHFLKVMAEHDRLDVLRSVYRLAREMYEEEQGRRTVVIRTAEPIDDAQVQAIADRLRGVLGIEPAIVREVAPELIGGVMLRIGDTVFDGSVATQLERARKHMLHRSTYEIQSGRDRFRDSGGD